MIIFKRKGFECYLKFSKQDQEYYATLYIGQDQIKVEGDTIDEAYADFIEEVETHIKQRDGIPIYWSQV